MSAHYKSLNSSRYGSLYRLNYNDRQRIDEDFCDTTVPYDIYAIEGLDKIPIKLLRKEYSEIKKFVESKGKKKIYLNMQIKRSGFITKAIQHTKDRNDKAIPIILDTLNKSDLFVRDLQKVIIGYDCGYVLQESS